VWNPGVSGLLEPADKTVMKFWIPSATALNFTPGKTSPEICEIVWMDEEDAMICSEQLNCNSCVKTIKSDGFSICEWYESAEYCSTGGCGLHGCGSTTCKTAETCSSTWW
jgi:hypothetical protein